MKILLVQTAFLGDTILSTPVIAGIKKIYPYAELWMMTTPLAASLVKRDPNLKGVITYDKRGKESGFAGMLRMSARIREMEFDRVYSLHKSYRTAFLLAHARIPKRIGFAEAKLSFLYNETCVRDSRQHDVVRNMMILHRNISSESLDMDLQLFCPERKELSENILNRLPRPKAYAVIVPGSVWKTKMWHYAHFRETARYLVQMGIKVVVLGCAKDNEVACKVSEGIDAINISGKTSIDEAMYIIKNAMLVICNDSMSLHMASAFKVPTVAVFCATSPSLGYGPWRNEAVVIEKDLECRPCGRHGGNKCPKRTEACMKDLSHIEAVKAIQHLLCLPEADGCHHNKTALWAHG